MKKYYVIAILLLITLTTSAQAVLLEQNVNNDTIKKTEGPNLKNYHHFYLTYGFMVDKAEKGADINYGNSSHFDIGYRYKLKVTNHYAVGTDLWWSFYSYNLKQSKTKVLPDTLLNDKEKLNFNNISLGLYNRINFGKRGNHIGNFLDIGAFGQYTFKLVHYTKNKMPNDNIVETYTKRLKYYNPLNWGLMARIGFNRYIITASYRMSDYFKSSYLYLGSKYPELSRLSIGAQIGLY